MPAGTRNGEIRIVGVTKRFGDMAAVDDVTITVGRTKPIAAFWDLLAAARRRSCA